MAAFYEKFLRSGIDLAPLGAGKSEDNTPYFCTPKGASIFGWAGVDGIHFCFVRGWGEMVFAVSPANGWGEYVHPIACDFADFLRLLLACGDTAAPEQAWQWEKARFDAFLEENPPTEEGRALLARIAERFSLTPMENPWEYLHELQESFDYGKIKYTEDLTDPDMNPAAPQKEAPWEVYFDSGFWGHRGTGRPGKEIAIDRRFFWAGHEWYAPALYVCSKGLVLDLCMKSETAEFAAFLEKWGFDEETGDAPTLTDEERWAAERENPLSLDCSASVTLSGTPLCAKHGYGMGWLPLLPGQCDDAEPFMRHYGLDRKSGWMLRRFAFLWKTKRAPKIKNLTLTMTADSVRVPAAHFHVEKVGDTAVISHGGTEYLLTVRELEAQTIDTAAFPKDRFYPAHCVAMSYTLSPEPPRGTLTVEDCAKSDSPVKIAQDDPLSPTATDDTCIGIIGGADGPTAIFAVSGRETDAQIHSACSALHFEPAAPQTVEWRAVFREVPCAPETVSLL